MARQDYEDTSNDYDGTTQADDEVEAYEEEAGEVDAKEELEDDGANGEDGEVAAEDVEGNGVGREDGEVAADGEEYKETVVAGVITAVQDETEGADDETTRQELADMFNANMDEDGDGFYDEMTGDEVAKVEGIDNKEDHDYRITITSATPEGVVFELEGKLDTGADLNCISEDAVDRYGMTTTTEEDEEGDTPNFKVGSGEEVPATGVVRLKYTAGKSNAFYLEKFHVVPGLPHDIIMGKPFMEHTDAVVVNPEFLKDPGEAEPEDEEAPEKDLQLLELHPQSKKGKKSSQTYADKTKAEREAAYIARTGR